MNYDLKLYVPGVLMESSPVLHHQKQIAIQIYHYGITVSEAKISMTQF